MLQEWLASQIAHLQSLDLGLEDGQFQLMSHCTERTSAAASIAQWLQVFSALGQTLSHQNLGCCGMAGTYGHETANLETSRQIYQLSWQKIVSNSDAAKRLVATGYSCRSQVKRMDATQIPHPLQALLKQLRTG